MYGFENETFLHVNMSYSRSLEQDLGIGMPHCHQVIMLALQNLLITQEMGKKVWILETGHEIFLSPARVAFLVNRSQFIRKPILKSPLYSLFFNPCV